MEKTIHIYKSFEEHEKGERARRRSMTPEERLDELELLRIGASKFLYAYPKRLRRIITVTRRKFR